MYKLKTLTKKKKKNQNKFWINFEISSDKVDILMIIYNCEMRWDILVVAIVAISPVAREFISQFQKLF